ncbi:MAG: hypothetical protein IJ343_10060 [Clostridia bacterium]|nr:hypothetical protein [Clostridia bacterium]
MKKLLVILLIALLACTAALAEDTRLTEAEAIAIARNRFLADTGWDAQTIDDSFEITTLLQDWPNGTSTWSVRLHYRPVDELCFYGVELDALTGEIYSAGPERFAEMLKVYEEYDRFEDYTAYHRQQYEWRWGLPASQWRYEQIAAFTAAHYTLGSFVAHSDAVLPTAADLPYEEALKLAFAAMDEQLSAAGRTDELVSWASTFHGEFVRAFGGMEGERQRRRVWEFVFLDNDARPLVTVYVGSPDGEVEAIPHFTLPEVTE